MWRLALIGFAAVVLGSSLDELAPPIQGLQLGDLRDMFHEIHNGHEHRAIDILEPRGTPVHAVVDGTVRKLFLSRPGGNTIYEFDKASMYCYYYAHLDHYAEGLREGMNVQKGDLIGYVGSTGNAAARAPHLHFAVTELPPDKVWWKGTEIDPYEALVDAVKRAK